MALSIEFKEQSFGVGDVVKIHHKVADRIQVYEGTIIGVRGRGTGKSFTVRRIGTQKVGIEQIFPLHSPLITKIEKVREGMRGVRRAKLYYIRNKSKKDIELIYSRAKKRALAKEAAKKKPSSQKKSSPKKKK
ncbi:MAG: 50S ribosomal protein L19 [Candidatus Woesebacteria bacterium GW2011_GWB1_43_14]|uniref:50S ribosomal protein L19 n=1 Tax=Candidatus Woesebacteria bacterium GW2011_GWB1_43_14 TaxID=1618578 RepID=A0A0G1DGZ5_9BACT|nr:MAG: 50S ribosomal protein L19 [Candidatus Woesebacteria bacterium GW2011_GWA1_39_11b]KKS78474.1 MAG: 50S ribosomal protein L19 [Candidatus Woesebacteria bacterium GW2011_GWC1_42_9]KKS97110.1 MAG: 50S ribosomal protein L19 [Candidatus Woesebacteria bacterium GW2011_GWB1_43_14]